MAILDTFYMMFKTNAAEARTGLNEAEVASGKFTASINRMDEGVVAAGERIVGTFGEIGAAIAAAFAVERIKEFLSETLEVNAALNDTSERLGVAVEDLAALQSVGKRFGGSADGVTASLDFLNRGLADIAVKGTSRLKPFFDDLGINVLKSKGHVKDLKDVLGELSDKLAAKTTQERAGLGERFALDPGLLLGMAEGRRALDDLIKRQKDLGVTTAEDAELADKFEKKLDDLHLVLSHLANEILGGFVPVLGKIVDGFMEIIQFIERHTDLVEGFFIGIGATILNFYLPAMLRAIAATAVWLAEVLLIPAIIVAAFAAFALAYDDVKNFLEGNNSVIGELSKKWPIVGKVVREVADDIVAAFKWVVDSIKSGASLIGSVINLLVAVFERVGGAIGSFFHNAGKLFADAFPFWTKLVLGTVEGLESLVTMIAKLIAWIGKFTWGALAKAPAFLSNLAGWLNSAAVSVNGPKLALGGTAPALGQRTKDNDARIARLYGPQAVRTAGQTGPAKPGAAPAPALTGRPPEGHDMTATVEAMKKAKGEVRVADATPLGAIGGAVTNNAGATHITKHTNVTVENVTIQTQATDINTIAGAVGDHLVDHVRKAINAHDDGVDR